MTNYELIKAARIKHGRHVLFEATHIETGIQSRYTVGEHLNVGEGYIMLDADNVSARAVPDIKLKDIVVVEPQA